MVLLNACWAVGHSINNEFQRTFCSVFSLTLQKDDTLLILLDRMSKYFNESLFLITILILVNIVPSESTDADENSVVEDRTTGALDFIVQTCSSLGNCQSLTTGLVVDNNWRGFHYNLCYDPKQCDKVIIKQLICRKGYIHVALFYLTTR